MSAFAEATLHQALGDMTMTQEAGPNKNSQGGTAEITWTDAQGKCHTLAMHQLASKTLQDLKAEVEAAFHLSWIERKIKRILVIMESADDYAGMRMSWADVQQIALRQDVPLQLVLEIKNVHDHRTVPLNDLSKMKMDDDWVAHSIE